MANDTPYSAADCLDALRVSRETAARLEAHVELLLRWQKRRNLIGRGTVDGIWRRHILDCGQLAALLPDGSGPIVDLGSGAGLPGIVLALMTGRHTDLVEADAAKAAFLHEAVRITGAPCAIHRSRIEDLAPWPCDVVTARALAPLRDLLAYAEPFFAQDGPNPLGMFPKGAKWREELTDSRKMWHISAREVPSKTDSEARILLIDVIDRA